MGEVETFQVSGKDYYKNCQSRIRVPGGGCVCVAPVEIKAESQIYRGNSYGVTAGVAKVLVTMDHWRMQTSTRYCMPLGIF